MMAEGRGKTSYTEKVSTHLPSGCCVHSNFSYWDVLDSLEMYHVKDCVENFKNPVEEAVKGLYETFP